MKLIFSTILIFSVLIGCAQNKRAGNEKSKYESLYQGSGVEKYFLGHLPQWANFVEGGSCYRKTSTHFLNFNIISKSYGFSYEELIQLQYMYNRRLSSFKKSSSLDVIRPKDESYIFYNVVDQIRGGAKEFKKPKFKKIFLIWIDPAMQSSKAWIKLRKFLKSSKVNEAVPLLVSLCRTNQEIQAFMSEKLKSFEGYLTISTEMFAPFETVLTKSPIFSLNFNEVFSEDQELIYINYEHTIPKNFRGKFKLNTL
jgi:hypothetical protein